VTGLPTRPGLYVHLPFCSRICPYCDFYVLSGDRDRRQQFTDWLIQEIELCARQLWPSFVDQPPREPFDTLYLGGGTPSLLHADELERLLAAIHSTLPIAAQPWIGFEANPEHVDERRLTTWRGLGVSFLSLGVQSFSNRKLEFLERTHRSGQARESVVLAKLSGIESISVDLIYGLPGETAEEWRGDLERALELQPDHLSCYQLTIEPRTPFGFRRERGQLVESDPEVQADLFLLTHRHLGEQGFPAYEVSNFAKAPEHRSRHNMKYWTHAPYLGVGPSAHSFANRQRWWNARKIKPWALLLGHDQRPIEGYEVLDRTSLSLERLMLGLRTPSGVDFASFPENTGRSICQGNRQLIDEICSNGWAVAEGWYLRPTLKGLALAEAIARRFQLRNSDPPEARRIC
jgi:oxygen-independent coproporphyrinogen-3 oxidase